VAQLVLVDPRDALGDLEIRAVPQAVAVAAPAAADSGPVREVRRLDDERVCLPSGRVNRRDTA